MFGRVTAGSLYPRKTAISQADVQTIPVFVISLLDCTERREAISQALSMLGIAFEFVDAVDGRHGLDPQYEDQVDRVETQRRTGYVLTDAEFACALSHINVYRRIVSENLAYALILEDDAIPFPNLVQFLTHHHYRDADLTQLHCSRPYVRRRGAKRVLGAYTSYLRLPRLNVLYAVAYTISYRAALHFVRYAVPVRKPADWPPCIDDLSANGQCRVIYPPLVGHGSAGKIQSVIQSSGRKNVKERRQRVWGVYIPPFREMVESWGRAPYKLLSKRLP